MKKSARLIFFGTENFSAPTLEKLLKSGYDVAAVVTKPDSPSGRGRKLKAPLVKEIALRRGVEVLQPEKLADISSKISSLDPEYGVLVAYGKIIPQATIDLFPGGIINVHPSLLPKYRGAAPIEGVILNGDSETGVSLMGLSAGMDEGPVYYQEHVKLGGGEERLKLYSQLAQTGANLIVNKLPDIIDGRLPAKAQDDSQATYTKLLKKDDGVMDFDNKSAEQLEREVRAYLGFPKSRARVAGHEVIVTKARVANSQDDGDLVIKCHPGWLEILEIVGPSGRSMSGAAFMRGYRKD